MKALLVTGASGFVGRTFCEEAVASGLSVVAVTRQATNLPNVQVMLLGGIDANTDWHATLLRCDVVVHLAARVHVMNERSAEPLQAFMDVNYHATINLAKQAAVAGVKRFVFVSSIGVNGAFTSKNNKFKEDDLSRPQNAYVVSKWQAELALRRLAIETELEVVIVRPPLVYGANAPGNFAEMLQVVALCLPLPLALVHNQRDFIYVGNLVNSLIACATHPTAAGQTYLVSDGESVSTPDLIRSLAKALGKSNLVFPFPISVMRLCAGLFGKSATVDRLTQSLQIDSSKIRNELGWNPPYAMQQGLQATADWYLQSIKNKT